MLAKHRTARWAKMAGWIFLPLLVVPAGALAMFWAASLGLVPGLTPPDAVVKPAVIVDKFSELRHLAASAGQQLQSARSDLLARLRRQEPAKAVIVEAPFFEIHPPVARPFVAKTTPASGQTVSAAGSQVAQPAAATKTGKEPKAQTKAAPSKAKSAETTATAPQKAQTARAASPASPAPSAQAASSVQEAKAQSAPASSAPGKTPAAAPSAPKLLAAPAQATPPGILAASSCRAESQAQMRPDAPAADQDPDLQAEVKPRQTGRARGSTLAAMMSHAVNPLATGTALADSGTPASNASQAASGGTSPEPAHAQEQPAFPDTFPQGSLGQMAKLRAELEQLKLQVHIEEVRQRLNQLKGQSAPPLPAPSLEFPPIGLPAPAAPASEPPRSPLRLLSIQSLNGKYTATVGTDSGPRVVRVNETVEGYRVVSISRNSVVINRGKGNEMLSIYE